MYEGHISLQTSQMKSSQVCKSGNKAVFDQTCLPTKHLKTLFQFAQKTVVLLMWVSPLWSDQGYFSAYIPPI